jgi:hypothetical protein
VSGPGDEPASESPAFGEGVDPQLFCARLVRSRLAPEFEETYLELAELYEEDLSDEIVLNELARFVADLLEADEDEGLIGRCSDLLEELMSQPGLDPLVTVYDQVLVCLPPGLRLRLAAYLGPLAAGLLAALEGEP